MADQATPAAEFRSAREEGALVELRPGRVVRMRNVTPSRLLRLGSIPDPLSALVVRVLYADSPQASNAAINDFFGLAEKVDTAREYVESLRVICTAALLEPRIVDNPQADDEIAIDDLSDYEQGLIANLAFLEVDALRAFRSQPAADVETLDAQPSEPLPTQQAIGG